MQDLLIDIDLNLNSSDEELDTIVQGYDGNDYIVILKNGCKIWELYNINNEEITYVPDITIRNGKNIKSFDKSPNKSPKTDTIKRGRGRPKKNPNQEPRKPRQPTAYNLFLKEKLKELSLTYPDLPNKDRMKIASNIWNERKIVFS